MSDSLENVTVHLYQGPHLTRQDFDFFEGALRSDETHVYAPETGPFTPSDEAGYSKIARGNTKDYQGVMQRVHSGSMQAAQIGGLYASRKQVALYDMPAADYYANPQAQSLLRSQQQGLNGMSHGQLTDFFMNIVTDSAAITTLRDEKYVENLNRKLPNLIAKNPNLSNKETIGVLVTFGDLHKKVGELLSGCVIVKTHGDIQQLSPDENCTTTIINGAEPSDAQINAGILSVLLNPYLFDTSSRNLRHVLNGITIEADQTQIAGAIEARKFGVDGVHQFILQIVNDKGVAMNSAESVTPGTFIPYTPRMTQIRVAGRLATVSSLF